MAKKETSVIKKALAEVFGAKNLSVRRGTGTAYCWIEVQITSQPGDDRSTVYAKAQGIIRDLEKEGKIKLSTYCTDDGQGKDRKCLLIDVR